MGKNFGQVKTYACKSGKTQRLRSLTCVRAKPAKLLIRKGNLREGVKVYSEGQKRSARNRPSPTSTHTKLVHVY